MKITRELVANYAKVSPATVSHVINGSKFVSDIVKERVKKAIEELGYYPDIAARSMVQKPTNHLGIYVYDIANPYFGQLISGIEQEGMANGYFINVCSQNTNLKQYVVNAVSRRLDAVYIATLLDYIDPLDIKKLINNDIKVLLSSNYDYFKDEIFHIDIDMLSGLQDCLEQLQNLGHHKIVYLDAFVKDYVYDVRSKLMIAECNSEKGFKLEIVRNEKENITTIDSGYKLCKRAIESKIDFSTVICTNDLMAIGAIKALRESGLNVPNDVSVLGFDNTIIGENYYPSISSIGCDVTEYGRIIFRAMLKSIKVNKKFTELIPTKFFLRQSVSKCSK